MQPVGRMHLKSNTVRKSLGETPFTRVDFLSIVDYGSWNLELEPGIWSLESGNWSLEPGIWGLESGIWSLESGVRAWGLESGAWSLAYGVKNVKQTLQNNAKINDNYMVWDT